MWPGEPGWSSHSQFSERRWGGRRMETGEKVRSFSRRLERRRHRDLTRLPLQLDGRLSLDETHEGGSCAVHSYGGIRDQITAADSDEWPGLPFRESCRSKG